MYAAKAAAGGAAPGQVQGQQGVPSSGQGMYRYDTNLALPLPLILTKVLTIFKGLHVCVKINDKAFVAFLLWQDDITHLLHRNTTIIL